MTAPFASSRPADADALAKGGTMVAVVGPSGAGKDTLMALAASHFVGRPDVHFVRRIITRAPDAASEDHDSVSEADFDAMQEAGAFAVWWNAHGLRYGIPAEVFERLRGGHLVIANGSRSALSRFRDAFPRLKVVNVTARRDVLAVRLAARGRETSEDIMQRLSRASLTVEGAFDVADIDNSGTVEDAGEKIIAVLEALLPPVG